MSELVVPGTITSESEFQGGLTGACGPNSVAAAGRWSDQANTPTTVSATAALQHVVNSPNGVSTMGELQQLAHNLGYDTVRYGGGDIITFVQQHGGHDALVMFYTNGQALHDEITGQGMDASGLRGHFNCGFGVNSGGASPHFGGRTVPAGMIVADGDNGATNPIVNGHRVHLGISPLMVYYAYTTLRNAGLADALAIKARKVPGIMIPAGWHDSANGDPTNFTATLASPNGIVSTRGFRHFILAYPGGWEPDNWILHTEENLNPVEVGNPSLGAGARLCCRYRVLGYTPAKNVYVMWSGQEILALRP